MIPTDHISEWTGTAPWPNTRDVEQDLILCRAVVAIHSDPILAQKLAFRGGTAIHKLYLTPPSRYSEDIDLVRITPEPIGQTLDRLKAALSFPGKPKVKQKMSNNVLLCKFESEPEPRVPRRLKIEINCKEHRAVIGYEKVRYSVRSGWFSGEANLTTYTLDELIGTKIRALCQRSKGRDLFDLYRAVKSEKVHVESALKCFREYLMDANIPVPPRRVFADNLEAKMDVPGFRMDLHPILRDGIDYDIDEAFRVVMDEVISHL